MQVRAPQGPQELDLGALEAMSPLPLSSGRGGSLLISPLSALWVTRPTLPAHRDPWTRDTIYVTDS